MIKVITKDHLIQALKDEREVFRKLDSTPVYRSLPTRNKLCDEELSEMNLGAVKALQRALADGSVQFNHRDPGIVRCYEMGWLHAEPLDADVSKLVCVFPTKLHQK